MRYDMKVRLSGDVTVTVEADSLEEAQEIAEETAEIGDVSSWSATATPVGVGEFPCGGCGHDLTAQAAPNGTVTCPNCGHREAV